VYWGKRRGALVLARLIPLSQAAQAVYEGLNVYLCLTGIMILAELTPDEGEDEGKFDWAATRRPQPARNFPVRLFVLICWVGARVTALLSNDATAVLTPAVRAVDRPSQLAPRPTGFGVHGECGKFCF
jgi:Na+/H+ antiporter NhaD/arsenite permease-like protein